MFLCLRKHHVMKVGRYSATCTNIGTTQTLVVSASAVSL